MKTKLFAIFVFCTVSISCGGNEKRMNTSKNSKNETALFAGGCFWCIESLLEKINGVKTATSGYAGGSRETADYKKIGNGSTKHREVVQVEFNPETISYFELVKAFLKTFDPTDEGGSFGDRGFQYTSAIFFKNESQKKDAENAIKWLQDKRIFPMKIITPVISASEFFPAEDYHQDYYKKNSIHYQRYFTGSGRKGFIEFHWPKILMDKKSSTGENKKDMEVKNVSFDPQSFKKPDKNDLKEKLSKLQFKVTQKDGTEKPFSNEYWDNKEKGIYVDIISGEPLFSSSDKFKSGTGWPSFTRPLVDKYIVEASDRKWGMIRTEVRSKHADSHLGHLFDDGPQPTGLRYCINSASLRFVPLEKMEAEGYSDFLKYVND